METSSALLALCVGNSPVSGEFPSQKPVTWIFDVFFDLGLSKRLSKQSRCRWFETPSRSLWRHCNDIMTYSYMKTSSSQCAKWPGISKVTFDQNRDELVWRGLVFVLASAKKMIKGLYWYHKRIGPSPNLLDKLQFHICNGMYKNLGIF